METNFDIKIIITDKSNNKDITIIVNNDQIDEIKQLYDYDLIAALIEQGIIELKQQQTTINEQG